MRLGALLMLALGACAADGPDRSDSEILDPGDTSQAEDEVDDLEDLDWEVPDGGPIRRIALEVEAREWERLHAHPDASIEVACTVTVDGVRVHDSELELHGGYARSVPKKSYRVELPDEPDVALDLFGDGRETQRRFVLKASWIDRSFLREWLTLMLVREEGGLAPRVAFAELIANGEWQGLYLVVERVDRGFFRRHGLGDEDLQLYKAEGHDANWADKPNPMAGYDLQIGEEGARDLGELLAALTDTPTTVADFRAEVEPRLALEDFLVWQRVHTFAGNRDTFTKNYYLYHDLEPAPGTPEARFRIVSWDADATFGLEWEGTPLPGDQRAWHGTDRFAPRLFAIPTWKGTYATAYREALAERWLPAPLAARVQDQAALIADLARRDLARWQPELDFDAEVERLAALIAVRHGVMTAVVSAL